jgi:hypothetical protein
LDISPVFFSKTTGDLFRMVQFAQATTTITPQSALSKVDLHINGAAISATSAVAQAGQTAASTWSLADALNRSGIGGLTAIANSATGSGSAVLIPGGGMVEAGSIVVNGVATGSGNYVNSVNAISGRTGVTARDVAGTASIGFPQPCPIHWYSQRPMDVTSMFPAWVPSV